MDSPPPPCNSATCHFPKPSSASLAPMWERKKLSPQGGRGPPSALHKELSKPNAQYPCLLCGFPLSFKRPKGTGSFGKNGGQKGEEEVGPEALLGGKTLQFYNLPKHVAKTSLPWGGVNVLWGRE